jgi:hypothetical protein
MLRPGEWATQNRKIYAFSEEVAQLTKPNISLQGLENHYRAFKTMVAIRGLYRQNEKAKT